MTTLTQTTSATRSAAFAVALVTLIASALLFTVGHAQSSVLHDAAHDMRHATGFPCH